jgi:hypothetical protein
MTFSMRSALLLAVLFCSAGCRAEMSDARRDHVLAGDHGWIDLTLKAAPASPAYDPKKSCVVSLSSGGEHLFSETADLARAAASQNPVGYRIVVPAGKAAVELTLQDCLPKPLVVTLPLELAKDHLARLAFDGSALMLQEMTPYEPTSLEWVRSEILKLQSSGQAAGEGMARLSTIAMASLALNLLTLLALLAFFLTRRRGAK